MAKQKRMRNLLGILKDKVSLIKATLNTRTTVSLHVAVLRATSHSPIDSPPEYLDDVLAITRHHHRPTAGALLHTLLRRVHNTSNAYVALKCLLTLHHIVSRGPAALNDLINGGPLLQLSTFSDQSDDDTRELSSWVRWYAATLDQEIYLITSSSKSLTMLISLLEQISGSPDSLHYQRISLIFEVMRSIGEDYRIIMRDIHAKVKAYGEEKNITHMNDESLGNFLGDLRRIEGCKEKLLAMFLNKKKNDGVWELIEKVRRDVEVEKQRRESMAMVVFQGSESANRVPAAVSRDDELRKALVVLPAPPRVRRWLDVEWNKVVVSAA